MSSSNELSQHIDKMLFIKRLQAREDTLNKFLSEGRSVLPSGGGLGHGGGLGRGGGMDSGGFFERPLNVRKQMLEDEVDTPAVAVASSSSSSSSSSSAAAPASPTPSKAVGSNEAVDVVEIQGTVSQPWKRDKKLTNEAIGNSHEKVKNIVKKEFSSQTGTKAVIVVKDGSGEVLKYRSIGDLARKSNLTKYKLIGKFNAKHTGDSVHSSQLGGTITFVDKADLMNF